jgi:OOP family OmpA-OmpF porin
LRSLKLLEGGSLRYGDDGMMVEGTAANPLARDRAAAALGDHGDLNVVLKDDGTPPNFTLTYDPARGARVTGKVPRDLTADRLAQALGLDTVRGAVPVSPDPALGELALEAWTSLRAWLPDIETIDMVHSPAGVGLTIAATPGVPADRFETVLRRALPVGAGLRVMAAEPPATGTRRQHIVLQEPQVFSAGLWLPDLAVAADAEGCAAGAEAVPQLAFERGGLDPAIGSGRSYAALVALTRACTRIAGLRAEVQVGTQETGIDALDRQLSRRRAENMVDRLVAHGVPEALISGGVLSGTEGIKLGFVQD